MQTLEILRKVRVKYDISTTSPVNLFISNGEFIAATRYVFDYGWHPLNKISGHYTYHSLWYTYGDGYQFYDGEYKMKDSASKSSIIIASEPLTEDVTTWIELPEYSLIVAWLKEDKIEIVTKDILL
jgi:glutamine amidotransferase